MRRTFAWAASALLCVGLPSAHAAPSTEDELAQISAGAAQLEARYLHATRAAKRSALTARLNMGQLLYERRDYERAAILLFDVVESAEAEQTPIYWEALHTLAQAHLELRNVRGAQEAMLRLTQARTPHLRDWALAQLIELALDRKDPERAQEAVALAQRLQGGAPSAQVLYALAKYEYQYGDKTRAIQLFEQVPADHEYGARSQYFAAVAALSLERVADAEARLRRLLSGAPAPRALPEGTAVSPEADLDAQVYDLARLAIARLHYERGELDEAIAHYGALSMGSIFFEQGLVESVWIDIKREAYDHAIRRLEIQLIAQPDIVRGYESRLLQGKLLLLQGRPDEAQESYETLAQEFEPVLLEMRRTVAQQAGKLDRYLHAQLSAGGNHFDPKRFLPPKAAHFVDSDEWAERAFVLVGDLGRQHADLEDTRELALEVEAALGAGGRLKLFPQVYEGWQQALEYRARALQVRIALNEAAAQGAPTSPEYAQLAAARGEWQARFLQLPLNVSARKARNQAEEKIAEELGQQIFRLNIELRSLEAQLVAIERYLADVLALSPQLVAGLPAHHQVQRERGELLRTQGAISALKRELTERQAQIGGADRSYEADEVIYRGLARALEAEAQWLRAQGRAPEAAALRRVEAVEAQVRAFIEQAVALTQTRTADYQARLDEERERLARYGQRLQTFDSESSAVGGALAAQTFLSVLGRISEVILQADVGLVEVAWQRKKSQSDEIREVLERQSAELTELERNYQELSRE